MHVLNYQKHRALSIISHLTETVKLILDPLSGRARTVAKISKPD